MERDQSFEYVLGLLPEEEVITFEKELSTNPAAYQSVIFWEKSFAPLVGAAPHVKNPVSYKSIEKAVFPRPTIKWVKILIFVLVTLAVIKGTIGLGLVLGL